MYRLFSVFLIAIVLHLSLVNIIQATGSAGTASSSAPATRQSRLEHRKAMRQRIIDARNARRRGPSSGSASVLPAAPEPEIVPVGIRLLNNGRVKYVTHVTVLSPADVAGLLPGDEIREIDGQPIKDNVGVEEIVSRLNGPEGTSVTVEIGRLNAGLMTFTILRKAEAREEYAAEMKGRIAYINIGRFSKSAIDRARDFLARQAAVKNPRGVIVDLRGNPGGGVEEVRKLAGFFLPKFTPLAGLETPGSSMLITSNGGPLLPVDTPLVILVTSGGPPAVALTAGGMKSAAPNQVTVIQTSAVSARYGNTDFLILGSTGMRTFTPPVDALLVPNSEVRTYLDASFVDFVTDEKDPAGTGADAALDRAIELLE